MFYLLQDEVFTIILFGIIFL